MARRTSQNHPKIINQDINVDTQHNNLNPDSNNQNNVLKKNIIQKQNDKNTTSNNNVDITQNETNHKIINTEIPFENQTELSLNNISSKKNKKKNKNNNEKPDESSNYIDNSKNIVLHDIIRNKNIPSNDIIAIVDEIGQQFKVNKQRRDDKKKNFNTLYNDIDKKIIDIETSLNQIINPSLNNKSLLKNRDNNNDDKKNQVVSQNSLANFVLTCDTYINKIKNLLQEVKMQSRLENDLCSKPLNRKSSSEDLYKQLSEFVDKQNLFYNKYISEINNNNITVTSDDTLNIENFNDNTKKGKNKGKNNKKISSKKSKNKNDLYDYDNNFDHDIEHDTSNCIFASSNLFGKLSHLDDNDNLNLNNNKKNDNVSISNNSNLLKNESNDQKKKEAFLFVAEFNDISNPDSISNNNDSLIGTIANKSVFNDLFVTDISQNSSNLFKKHNLFSRIEKDKVYVKFLRQQFCYCLDNEDLKTFLSITQKLEDDCKIKIDALAKIIRDIRVFERKSKSLIKLNSILSKILSPNTNPLDKEIIEKYGSDLSGLSAHDIVEYSFELNSSQNNRNATNLVDKKNDNVNPSSFSAAFWLMNSNGNMNKQMTVINFFLRNIENTFKVAVLLPVNPDKNFHIANENVMNYYYTLSSNNNSILISGLENCVDKCKSFLSKCDFNNLSRLEINDHTIKILLRRLEKDENQLQQHNDSKTEKNEVSDKPNKKRIERSKTLLRCIEEKFNVLIKIDFSDLLFLGNPSDVEKAKEYIIENVIKGKDINGLLRMTRIGKFKNDDSRLSKNDSINDTEAHEVNNAFNNNKSRNDQGASLLIENPIARYLQYYKIDLIKELEEKFNVKIAIHGLKIPNIQSTTKEIINQVNNDNSLISTALLTNLQKSSVSIRSIDGDFNIINNVINILNVEVVSKLQVFYMYFKGLVDRSFYGNPKFTQYRRSKDVSLTRVGDELYEIVGMKDKCIEIKERLENLIHLQPVIVDGKIEKVIMTNDKFIKLLEKMYVSMKNPNIKNNENNQLHLSIRHLKNGSLMVDVKHDNDESEVNVERKKAILDFIKNLDPVSCARCFNNITLVEEAICCVDGKRELKSIENEFDVRFHILKNNVGRQNTNLIESTDNNKIDITFTIWIFGVSAESVTLASSRFTNFLNTIRMSENVSNNESICDSSNLTLPYVIKYHPIEKDYIRCIVGRNGSVLSRIKAENSLTCIVVDDINSSVIIVGSKKSDIDSTMETIDNIIASVKKANLAANHSQQTHDQSADYIADCNGVSGEIEHNSDILSKNVSKTAEGGSYNMTGGRRQNFRGSSRSRAGGYRRRNSSSGRGGDDDDFSTNNYRGRNKSGYSRNYPPKNRRGGLFAKKDATRGSDDGNFISESNGIEMNNEIVFPPLHANLRTRHPRSYKKTIQNVSKFPPTTFDENSIVSTEGHALNEDACC